MKKALESPVIDLLSNFGFKQNGDDFYRTYAITDLENYWEEEVYVFRDVTGNYTIWYPERESKNKTYKTTSGILKYIQKEFWHFKDSGF